MDSSSQEDLGNDDIELLDEEDVLNEIGADQYTGKE